MRLIKTLKNGTHTVKVKYHSAWNEYRVQLDTAGKHIEAADYFTDDKQDALNTAQDMLKRTMYFMGMPAID